MQLNLVLSLLNILRFLYQQSEIFSDLLNACDYYNLEKLISISESYIKQLNPFKEYIFFHEYYECFKWIYTPYPAKISFYTIAGKDTNLCAMSGTGFRKWGDEHDAETNN